MIIINPVIAESNYDDVLENGSTQCYRALMEFRPNDQLRRMLPQNNISQTLRGYHWEHGFSLCTVLYAVHGEITVLCIGVGPSVDEGGYQALVDNLTETLKEGEAITPSEMADIPGAEVLLSILEENNLCETVSWDVCRERIRESGGSKK